MFHFCLYFYYKIHMPGIPQLKSDGTRKQVEASKSKPVTPGLPAIDKREVSDTS